MIQSLLKALNILNLFTRERPELRLTEICALLQIPPSTGHRLLSTLERENFITQNPENGKYLLGAAAFIVGTNVPQINQLVEVSLPYIAGLATKYKATAHVAVEQNGHVLCVEKIESPFNVVASPARGVGHELHLTSVGKCILAFSPPKKQEALMKKIHFRALTPASITTKESLKRELGQIKKEGYARDVCESAVGLYCFGAPILSSAGYAIGAISVSLNADCVPECAPGIIEEVKRSAWSINRQLTENAQRDKILPQTTS